MVFKDFPVTAEDMKKFKDLDLSYEDVYAIFNNYVLNLNMNLSENNKINSHPRDFKSMEAQVNQLSVTLAEMQVWILNLKKYYNIYHIMREKS